MKKMLKWYSMLKANDLLRFEEPTAEEAAPIAEAPVPVEPATEEKPKKAAKKKKTESSEEPAATEGEEKPAKKTARKKKTEE